MNYYLIDSNNIVVNNIVYDGVSSYIPAEGLTLQFSSNNYNLGDTFVS